MSMYLVHHGIKGQRWGIRRFQNPDGTLTEDGRKRKFKRLMSMSGKKVYKTLKRDIRKERARQYGKGNRWDPNLEIGQKSKKLREEYKRNFSAWQNSPEFKKWDRKGLRLDKLSFDEKISPDEYDKRWHELYNQRPEKNFLDLGFAISYGKNGREYADDYLNKGGKQLSIARLEDLGYDTRDAEKLVEKMIKANRSIGPI